MNELNQFLESHTGPALFLAIFAEQIGLLLPATPLLVAAGAFVTDAALSPVMTIAVTVAACVLADLMWFYIGRRGGDRLLRFLHRLPLFDRSCFERTERLFAKYGMQAVAAAKFLPGLSLSMPPLAGAFRIGVGKFLWFDALGSLLYAVVYLGLGYLFSNEVNGLLHQLSQFGVGTTALATGLISILVA